MQELPAGCPFFRLPAAFPTSPSLEAPPSLVFHPPSSVVAPWMPRGRLPAKLRGLLNHPGPQGPSREGWRRWGSAGHLSGLQISKYLPVALSGSSSQAKGQEPLHPAPSRGLGTGALSSSVGSSSVVRQPGKVLHALSLGSSSQQPVRSSPPTPARGAEAQGLQT